MTRTARIALLVALALVAWFGYDMMMRTVQEQLWGWRPLALMLSAWCAFILIVGRKRRGPENQRWLMLSSLAGVCLGLGFPPSPLIPFAFIGFVPLFLVEDEISRSAKRPGLKVLGFAFNAFLIWNILTTWWVLNTSFLPGIVANMLNAFFMALVFLLYHHVKKHLGERLHWLIFAAIWISWEWFHMQWELSWPWLTLGNSFAEYPSWVQWYDVTGVFGGSLWILTVNGLLYEMIREKLSGSPWSRRRLAGVLGIVLLPIGYGMVKYFSYDLPEGNTEIAVIQPNFEPHYSKFNVSQRKQLEQFLRLSDSIVTSETEYLVFPETSFGLVELNTIESDYRIMALRLLLEKYPKLKLITGLSSSRIHETELDIPSIRTYLTRAGDTIYWDLQNSAIQLEDTADVEIYFKSKLVPGAEIFPFRKVLPFIEPLVKMLDGTTAGHTMQEERQVFNSSSGRVAPIICYESVYGAYVGDYLKKGADILFIITNDGWWDDTPGHIQHLKLGALRAIEHRRPIARSANTGISCFINERGDVLQPTRYGETIAILGKVNNNPEVVTFYTRWGDVIARLCLFLTGLFFVLAVARRFTPSQ